MFSWLFESEPEVKKQYATLDEADKLLKHHRESVDTLKQETYPVAGGNFDEDVLNQQALQTIHVKNQDGELDEEMDHRKDKEAEASLMKSSVFLDDAPLYPPRMIQDTIMYPFPQGGREWMYSTFGDKRWEAREKAKKLKQHARSIQADGDEAAANMRILRVERHMRRKRMRDFVVVVFYALLCILPVLSQNLWSPVMTGNCSGKIDKNKQCIIQPHSVFDMRCAVLMLLVAKLFALDLTALGVSEDADFWTKARAVALNVLGAKLDDEKWKNQEEYRYNKDGVFTKKTFKEYWKGTNWKTEWDKLVGSKEQLRYDPDAHGLAYPYWDFIEKYGKTLGNHKWEKADAFPPVIRLSTSNAKKVELPQTWGDFLALSKGSASKAWDAWRAAAPVSDDPAMKMMWDGAKWWLELATSIFNKWGTIVLCGLEAFRAYRPRFEDESLHAVSFNDYLIVVTDPTRIPKNVNHCMQFQSYEEVAIAAESYYGGVSLFLFMMGAVALSLGEIMKMTIDQDFLIKGWVDVEELLQQNAALRDSDFMKGLREGKQIILESMPEPQSRLRKFIQSLCGCCNPVSLKKDPGMSVEAGEDVKNLGIKAAAAPPGYPEIKVVMKGTWAEEVGIKAGWTLYEINGEDVVDITQEVLNEHLKRRPLKLYLDDWTQFDLGKKAIKAARIPGYSEARKIIATTDLDRVAWPYLLQAFAMALWIPVDFVMLHPCLEYNTNVDEGAFFGLVDLSGDGGNLFLPATQAVALLVTILLFVIFACSRIRQHFEVDRCCFLYTSAELLFAVIFVYCLTFGTLHKEKKKKMMMSKGQLGGDYNDIAANDIRRAWNMTKYMPGGMLHTTTPLPLRNPGAPRENSLTISHIERAFHWSGGPDILKMIGVAIGIYPEVNWFQLLMFVYTVSYSIRKSIQIAVDPAMCGHQTLEKLLPKSWVRLPVQQQKYFEKVVIMPETYKVWDDILQQVITRRKNSQPSEAEEAGYEAIGQADVYTKPMLAIAKEGEEAQIINDGGGRELKRRQEHKESKDSPKQEMRRPMERAEGVGVFTIGLDHTVPAGSTGLEFESYPPGRVVIKSVDPESAAGKYKVCKGDILMHFVRKKRQGEPGPLIEHSGEQFLVQEACELSETKFKECLAERPLGLTLQGGGICYVTFQAGALLPFEIDSWPPGAVTVKTTGGRPRGQAAKDNQSGGVPEPEIKSGNVLLAVDNEDVIFLSPEELEYRLLLRPITIKFRKSFGNDDGADRKNEGTFGEEPDTIIMEPGYPSEPPGELDPPESVSGSDPPGSAVFSGGQQANELDRPGSAVFSGGRRDSGSDPPGSAVFSGGRRDSEPDPPGSVSFAPG